MNFTNTHCCKMMTENVEARCDQHPNRFDCPDMLVDYAEKFDSYGLIIHGTGSSVLEIMYCPWCGAKLRSLRNQLFDELDALGLDALSDTLPAKYHTAEWWMKKEQ